MQNIFLMFDNLSSRLAHVTNLAAKTSPVSFLLHFITRPNLPLKCYSVILGNIISLSLSSLSKQKEKYIFCLCWPKSSINSLWSLPHCKTCNTRKWEGSEESSDIVALSSHLASKYQLKMIGPANTERRIGLMAWYYLPQCNLSNGELQHTLNIGTANWLQLMFLVSKNSNYDKWISGIALFNLNNLNHFYLQV